MIAVLQRVDRARVSVDGVTSGQIGQGLLVLLGVKEGDEGRDAQLLAAKISSIRIFADDEGKQNRSLLDVGGEVLLVSNFTLCANYRHGNRPDYLAAAKPGEAEALYLRLAELLEERLGKPTQKGVFGAHMQVEPICNGPLTIVLDSEVLKAPRRA